VVCSKYSLWVDEHPEGLVDGRSGGVGATSVLDDDVGTVFAEGTSG
jgi:hypothetical protein